MTLGVIVMIIILAIAIPMFSQKVIKFVTGKLDLSHQLLNMYKILIEETENTVEVKDGMGKTRFLIV